MAGVEARFGWYGDDFTGATDTLGVLAQTGQRAMLFLGVPSAEHLAAAGPLDAIGIAGAARAMGPEAMAAELEPVGAFFAASGVRIFHYKCCSTFDSAPRMGSIGAAARILRSHFRNPFLPIVGGQPNIGRYCLFSNLFASDGIGGEVHRIDHHPTMSRHPVTPMGESDLRRHLVAQGLSDIAAIHYPSYAMGETTIDRTVQRFLDQGQTAVLLDIADPADLAWAGRLIWRRALREPLMAIGASSVAQATMAAWCDRTKAAECAYPNVLPPADGPVLVMAGSLSPVTRRQVEAAQSFRRFQLDAAHVIEGGDATRSLTAEVAAALRAGHHVMVVTAPVEGESADITQAPLVAKATAAFLAEVMQIAPVRRLGVAGGDTSSHAVRALGLWGLTYETTLGPGVAICRARCDNPRLDGIEVMLKGGQMGPLDLFERLLGDQPSAYALQWLQASKVVAE